MGRYFSDNIQAQALDRQNMRCAFKGEKFFNRNEALEAYVAHHMQRYADGGSSDLGNCVMLCEDCHDHVHGGDTRKPIQLSASDFPYFNG